MVFDSFVDVFDAPDSFEPDADSDLDGPDPDAPVVAAALPSVDDWADPEPVDFGASVIVPLAEPEPVDEGMADCDESGGDDVCDGPTKDVQRPRYEYN